MEWEQRALDDLLPPHGPLEVVQGRYVLRLPQELSEAAQELLEALLAQLVFDGARAADS